MRRIGVAALLIALASLGLAEDARKSGFEFMQPPTQALQKDDTQNPAMLWVKDGQALWSSPDGTAKKSCADCHGEINRMRGVATRYPQYSGDAKRVINLSQQINLCRATQQRAKAWRNTLQPTHRPSRPKLPRLPRFPRRKTTRRQHHPASASNRLPDLSPRMAKRG